MKKSDDKILISLRFDETEYGFLYEVKDKRGCSVTSYILFLIDRALYEISLVGYIRYKNFIMSFFPLIKQGKPTENFRLNIPNYTYNKLKEIKKTTGISVNNQIRLIIIRRIEEYVQLKGELFKI